MQAAANDSPAYRHQYSELLITTTTTDSSDCCSVTYTVPAYSGSDGTTYSTGAIYHQPNCQCHKMSCQPPTCQSPTHKSDHTDSSTDTGNSTAKDTWITQTQYQTTNRWKKPIAWIWAIITLLIFLICILCLTQAGWLVNSKTGESLGLLKQSKINPTTKQLVTQSYKQLSTLNLPSPSWKIALVVYSISTTLLGLGTLLAFGAVLLTLTKTRENVTFCAGYVQLFAVILLITSILFYMVGLDAPTVKDICRSSTVFHTGDCDIGWNYLLLIISSALGLLLPVLSHYIDNNLCSSSQTQTEQFVT